MITASPVWVEICTSPTSRRRRCTASSPSSSFSASYSAVSPALVSTVIVMLAEVLVVEPGERPVYRLAMSEPAAGMNL